MSPNKKLHRYLIIVKQQFVKNTVRYVGDAGQWDPTKEELIESAAPVIVGEGDFESPEAALEHYSKFNPIHTLTVREIPRKFRPFTPEEAFARTDQKLILKSEGWVCSFTVDKTGTLSATTINKNGGTTLICNNVPLSEAADEFTFEDGSYFGVEEYLTDSIWSDPKACT